MFLQSTNIFAALSFCFSIFICLRKLNFHGYIIRQFVTDQLHEDDLNWCLNMYGQSFSLVQNIQGLPKSCHATTLEKRLTVRRFSSQSFLWRCVTPVQCFIRTVLLVSQSFYQQKKRADMFLSLSLSSSLFVALPVKDSLSFKLQQRFLISQHIRTPQWCNFHIIKSLMHLSKLLTPPVVTVKKIFVHGKFEQHCEFLSCKSFYNHHFWPPSKTGQMQCWM